MSAYKVNFNWLSHNPFEWLGRKVQNTSSGETYTVLEILYNGRIVMERQRAFYEADVATLRRDYAVPPIIEDTEDHDCQR